MLYLSWNFVALSLTCILLYLVYFVQIFVEDLFRSYMHLLVNSRSQLALARVFNIPERGLDHKAFTYLKHEASVCGLSMFQVNVRDNFHGT